MDGANGSRAILGIPYVNRPDLLEKAVGSLGALRSLALIVDNSDAGLDPAAWQIPVLRPSVPLSVSQTMNLLHRRAAAGACRMLLYMHSDAEAGPGTTERLLEAAEEATASGRRWGAIFTLYDVLAAYNLEAFSAVGGWDTVLPQYFTDNDYYRRIRLAGFETIETGLPVTHETSSTIRSDGVRAYMNSVTFPLYERYYAMKWGGPPGQERFTQPFNGSLPAR